MPRIAEFAKVSFNQFETAWKNTFLTDDAEIRRIYDSIRLPSRATSGSAGYDFYTPVDISLKPKRIFYCRREYASEWKTAGFWALCPNPGWVLNTACKWTIRLG